MFIYLSKTHTTPFLKRIQHRPWADRPGTGIPHITIVCSVQEPQKTSSRCDMLKQNRIGCVLKKCANFTAWTSEEKRQLTRRKGLCYNYLHRGHIANQCQRNSMCLKESCIKKHIIPLIQKKLKPEQIIASSHQNQNQNIYLLRSYNKAFCKH